MMPRSVAVLVLAGMSVAQEPVLTEFMARNAATLADRDGEYKDWFEVHNPRSTTLALGGYYVTDDPSVLTKWRFPTTSIAAGGRLVVFASYKNRATSGQQLHTNFNLDGDGEDLLLVKPDGVTVVSAFRNYPSQRTGFSYGRTGSGFGFFPQPTPGRANGSSVPGFVGETTIHAKRGLHTTALNVAITCTTAGATIRYTLDGQPPTATTGAVYSAPLRVTGSTVVRAAAFHTGLGPSPIDSRSIVFVDDVVRQPDWPNGFPRAWAGAPAADYGMDPEITQSATYRTSVKTGLQSLPTLSLTFKTDDFFGSSGIYINPLKSGPAWEREVSAEYFDPKKGVEFHTHAGCRIQGGASRLPVKSPKHSFSLRFRDSYEGDLKFPVFPGSRVARFDSLHLRAVFGNSFLHWQHIERARTQMTRDQFLKDALHEMGNDDAGHARYVCLYLNGLFWGVYIVHERPDANHYAAWHGGKAKELDARNGTKVVDGTAAKWNAMRAAVVARNWVDVQKRLNVDSYIDWLIINRFVGNVDLKSTENWRTAGGGLHTVPFHFYSWDAERVLESVNQTGIRPSSDPPGLLAYLDDIPDFVTRFGDRVQKHFYNGGALTASRNIARHMARSNEIDTAIVAESARWGDYRKDKHSYRIGPYLLYTRNDHWLPERKRLIGSYFPKRSAGVVGQFVSMGLYPKIATPFFSQHGGSVPEGYKLLIGWGPGKVYYTTDGTDPRAPGGAISRTAQLYNTSNGIIIRSITTVKARVLDGTKWSALLEARFLIESVRINEFVAKNDNGIRDNYGEREDWVELYNTSKTTVNLGGMFLADARSGAGRYRIPDGTTLQPGATLLLWADDDLNQGKWHMPFKLSAGGESLVLFDVDGRTILDELTFGAQQADIATGRFFDGGKPWATLLTPTPDQPNELPVCGVRRYSALDSTRQSLTLDVVGTPGIGKSITLQSRGGATSGQRALVFGVLTDEIPLPTSSSRLLIGGPLFLLGAKPVGAGGSADFGIAIPNQAGLVGQSVYMQSWGLGAGPWQGSNGVEIKVCR